MESALGTGLRGNGPGLGREEPSPMSRGQVLLPVLLATPLPQPHFHPGGVGGSFFFTYFSITAPFFI